LEDGGKMWGVRENGGALWGRPRPTPGCNAEEEEWYAPCDEDWLQTITVHSLITLSFTLYSLVTEKAFLIKLPNYLNCGHQGTYIRPPDDIRVCKGAVEWYWQEKSKYLERYLSQCHFAHHKLHAKHDLDSNPGTRCERPATNCLIHGTVY
jgi:hypothetical protein